MLDSTLRVFVAMGLLAVPWAHAYAPEGTVWVAAAIGTVFWGVGLFRFRSLDRRPRWGVICLLVFVALQALSLLNRGTIDPGEGFPGDGRITDPLRGWLPGTVAGSASVVWLAWWWVLGGLVSWWVSLPRAAGAGETLWLGALFCGALVAIGAGLAGKAGYILPGFSDHHGVFQPFAYRNHGVAYATLGICAGLALAVRQWTKQRIVAVLLLVLGVSALVALPWSQSRFAFVPQLVLLSGLVFLAVRRLLPQWRGILARGRAKTFLALLVGAGLVSIWMLGDFTGRMRDTYRQVDLVMAGKYPDLRLPSAGSALEAGWDRFPWGWGGGSYTEVLPLFAGKAFYAERYQPETKNFGRLIPSPAAHNDWAEWWAEFGALGLGLLVAALWLLRTKSAGVGAAERTVLFLGLMVLLVFSLFDYPLHSPPVLFAGMVYWSRQRANAQDAV